MIVRRPRERLLAWVVTGPLGHLYSTAADIAEAWLRWALPRARARLARSMSDYLPHRGGDPTSKETDISP